MMNRLVLVCRTKKIKHNLYWVECLERNLNKESVPLAHCTIPQTRKLKRLKLTALIALGRNKSGILIDIIEKIKALTLVIVKTAYDVYRIEMSRRSKCIA